MKNTFKNVLLFLSAFIPMYFLIIVKLLIEILNKNLSFNVLNTLVLIVLVVVIILGVMGVKAEVNNKQQKSSKVTILTFKNITDQHFLGYFSLFVLFAITFDLSKVSMAIVFVLILTMIGVVYVKNKLFYINPFLNILGYNFYDISYKDFNSDDTQETRIFYKGNLIKNKEYWVKIKDDNFSFVDETNKKGVSPKTPEKSKLTPNTK